jgi:flagellar protein FlaI
VLAQIDLPFPKERFTKREPSFRGNLLSQFPQALQEAAREKDYLSEYLQAIPVEEIGIPAYYPKLSKKLEKLRNRNLIYPIENGLFVHIYPEPKSERDAYIPIDPALTLELDDIVQKVEVKLLDMAEEIGQAAEEERKQILLDCLNKICTTGYRDRRNNKDKIRVTPRQLEGLKYVILRDKLGLGVLQPFLFDPYIEDISCSGTGHVFLEHKIFKSLRTALVFPCLDGLDDFVVWLGERIKKPVTLRHPIVDAVLPDGSRINIVYGRDIAKRGSNFTIRKFSKDPLSILQLIEFGTLDYLMAAYLWLAIEEGLNIFIAGTTASGKTTTLNAITAFIPPDGKIVSIEDTPELHTSHKNWIREVVREMSKLEKGGSVNMFDLLKAAMRQRPDRIIIGEIRGVEGNIAFQAMQTGHGVMSTFHASSVEKLIQRLTGEPINVPKAYIDNLDIVVIQAAVRGPDGRTVRRVVSINEIVDYDPSSSTYTFITAFRWRAENDTFEFPGDMNSYVLERKVAMKRGLPESKRRLVYSELRRRAAVLERLHRKGVKKFDKLFQVLAEAQKQGLI